MTRARRRQILRYLYVDADPAGIRERLTRTVAPALPGVEFSPVLDTPHVQPGRQHDPQAAA